jgi:hypothetical protein
VSRTPPTARRRWRLATLLIAGLAGCAGKAPPPAPGTSRGIPPDLRGTRVMVLPVQDNRGVPGDLDAEIAFALGDRGKGVDWIFPAQLERALERSPGLDTEIHGLPVGMFEGGEVRRVGDPLYGDLRRLSAVVDGEVALIPVSAMLTPTAQDSVQLQLSATLVHVRTGRVLWFGVAGGDAGTGDDPRVLASAVDRLARTLLWYAGR